jgi:hypothetical protein
MLDILLTRAMRLLIPCFHIGRHGSAAFVVLTNDTNTSSQTTNEYRLCVDALDL